MSNPADSIPALTSAIPAAVSINNYHKKLEPLIYLITFALWCFGAYAWTAMFFHCYLGGIPQGYGLKGLFLWTGTPYALSWWAVHFLCLVPFKYPIWAAVKKLRF